MKTMTFKEASEYVLPFGRDKGKTLDQIAETDEGLIDLDGLLDKDWLRENTRQAITVYLMNPAIGRELERALEER
jgi:hypothetical protein